MISRFALGMIAGLLSACALAAPAKVDGNRLTYLDSDSPYYPHRTFPKLITPQWAGEEGVEAVVIMAIDDMRDHRKYEAFCRPIMDRLKKIDGRAALSIMTCKIDPATPMLQDWLKEGVSLECHTADHPCPLLGGKVTATPGNALPAGEAKLDAFGQAKLTYDRCVENLFAVPGNVPVAFRTPCCDSRNTVSPRIFAEIFNQTTPGKNGKFLQIDSSVFNVTTGNDPDLPREIRFDADGQERFRKYTQFESFVNTIEDYPYPYVINKLCWEFPCATPSDWQAQSLHKPANPKTTEDWKRQLDATVIKKGVMTMVFHPYGWSTPEQHVELIEYAQKTYGKRVKFLTFKEAGERLTKNLLLGQGLRDKDGGDNGVRVLDLDNDGFMDVVIGNEKVKKTRRWSPTDNTWVDGAFPKHLVEADGSNSGERIGIFSRSGKVSLISRSSAYQFATSEWIRDLDLVKRIEAIPTNFFLPGKGTIADLDGDGVCELVSMYGDPADGVYRYNVKELRWERLGFGLPARVSAVADHAECDYRVVDIDEDGHLDLVISNENEFGVYLWESIEKGWSRELMKGNRDNASGIPAIAWKGMNNGFFVHSRTLWWQNENTVGLPQIVDRRTFNDLLKGVQPGPKTPEASLKCIKVAPGYKVELVAAEPLVQDPIAFSFGTHGEMYVVEMGDYPLGATGKAAGNPQASGRVRVLTSSKGDGVFDRSTLFMEKLAFPTSVLPWRDGVLVACAPDILFARDTNGDGVADETRVLFTGFVQGNQQHRVNGLSYGLDGWVYGANGDSGGVIQSKVKAGLAPVNISGRDFRFKPDTGEFEAISGGSQFGRSRNDYGDWFGCNNSNPIWQYPLDERVISRNPHVAVAPGLMKVDVPEIPGAAPVFPISRTLARFNDLHTANHFTSACSVHVYRDEFLFARGDEGHWRIPIGRVGVPRDQGWQAVAGAEDGLEFRKESGRKIAVGDTVFVEYEDSARGVIAIDRMIASTEGNLLPPTRKRIQAVGLTGAELVRAVRKAWSEGLMEPGFDLIRVRLPVTRVPDPYAEQVFVSEPVHNLVHREVMTRVDGGITYRSTRPPTEKNSEFLASSDGWFRPTTVATGPDDALYIADMYRHVIEHPQWIPKEWQEKLDLRAGDSMGRIYRVVPVDAKPAAIPVLEKLTTAQLVEKLDSSNGPVRDLAHQMILWRGEKAAAPLLVKLAKDELRPQVARVHAMYLLHDLGELTPDLIMRTTLDWDADSHEFTRHAIRLAGFEIARQPAKAKEFVEAVSGVPKGMPLIDVEVAAVLGHDPDSAAALARLAIEVAHDPADPSPPRKADPYVVSAAVASLNEKNISAVAAEMLKLAKTAELPPAFVTGVIKTALGTNQAGAIATCLDAFTTPADAAKNLYEAWQFRTLADLLDSMGQTKTPLATLMTNTPALKSAVEKIPQATKVARAWVMDEKLPIEDRAAALGVLGREADQLKADAAIFDATLSPQASPAMQSAAIATLSKRGGADVPRRLLSHWKSLSPVLRNSVVDALAARRDWAEALIVAVEKGELKSTEIDAARRLRLQQSGPGALRARAAKVFAEAINPDRQRVVDSFKPALTLTANAAAGKAIFAKTCATCHVFGGAGNAVGPDLASVGDKSPEGLLVAVLDPNRVVEARYVNYIADTRDGETHTGILTAETATSITLIGPDAKPITLIRSDLKELRSSNSSLMPEGLEASLKPQDLADLMAYIRQGK